MENTVPSLCLQFSIKTEILQFYSKVQALANSPGREAKKRMKRIRACA